MPSIHLPMQIMKFTYADNEVPFNGEKNLDGVKWNNSSWINYKSKAADPATNTVTVLSAIKETSSYWSLSNNSQIVLSADQNMQTENSFTVFPNPASISAPISINITGFNKEDLVVKIHDLSGKLVYLETFLPDNQTRITLNFLNELTPGLYLITASSVNEIYQQKLIIQ
jgi:hypothetical protein